MDYHTVKPTNMTVSRRIFRNKNKYRFSVKLDIMIFVSIILLGCSTKRDLNEAKATPDALKAKIAWEYLSSKSGDVPLSGPSNQQTALQVLGVDLDGDEKKKSRQEAIGIKIRVIRRRLGKGT